MHVYYTYTNYVVSTTLKKKQNKTNKLLKLKSNLNVYYKLLEEEGDKVN